MTATDELDTRLLDAAVELMGQAGRRGVVQVCGASMHPTLSPDDLLWVEFSPARLLVGDLLLFRQAGYLVVHRYVWTARDETGRRVLRTRGDAACGADPPLETGQVVGRVVAVRRGAVWRSMCGPAARVYARLAAAHDVVWAVATARGQGLDRRLGVRRPPGWIRAASWWIDRRGMSLLHRLFFKAAHPAIEPPAEITELETGPAQEKPDRQAG